MAIGDLLRRLTGPIRRAGPAGSKTFAVISRAIHERDERPIFVYREPPARRTDSGWTLTLGEPFPSDPNEPHPPLEAAHIGHLAEQWAELAAVFQDGRPVSAWEWDPSRGSYREIVKGRPGGGPLPATREPGVVELFAHDQEALAFRFAAADPDVVAAVWALERSARAQAWPARSRLAMAGIEVLTGAPAETDLQRSRSPVLEMPPELRQLAHRTDVRDEIATRLASVRHTSAGWGWLIVDITSPANLVNTYYVQFTSYPGPGIRAEATGNSHLSSERQLGELAASRMRELGWSQGSQEGADGNWVQSVRGGPLANRERLAELALQTFEAAFGCGPGTRYRVAIDRWAPEDVL